ncbi:hypothetical protein ELG63_10850 [Rhizobium leguminosarum]|nr:hypothetical protein ELG63_10850 [Rhizobium leguminosarum]
MVPARSSRHGISCSWHLSPSQAEIPLIPAVQISRASSQFSPQPVLRSLVSVFRNFFNSIVDSGTAGLRREPLTDTYQCSTATNLTRPDINQLVQQVAGFLIEPVIDII